MFSKRPGILWEATVPDSVYVIPVVATGNGIDIVIMESDTNDPVHDIRFVMPGFEPTYETDPFHPNFIDLLEPFSCLRFMKPLGVEENSITDWADRTPAELFTTMLQKTMVGSGTFSLMNWPSNSATMNKRIFGSMSPPQLRMTISTAWQRCSGMN